MMQDTTFIHRVRLGNYKSIASCDISLNPLVFLVGRNGAGKSNFLDALRFIADALRTTLDHALRDRGGINEVRRRSLGHPTHFAIRLDFRIDAERYGFYAFRIGSQQQGGYEVQTEQCKIFALNPPAVHFFKIDNRQVTSTIERPPAAPGDRLYLVQVSGYEEFRAAYELLSHMGFYNLNPDRIRELQPPDAGEILTRDGGNLASVLARMDSHSPLKKKWIEEYLGKISDGITGIQKKSLGPRETIEFRQKVGNSEAPWRFSASNMSDGTLRALGILTAIFQDREGGGRRIPLIGIEEPETALHPAAAAVLLSSLRSASRGTQIIVTSHSPDLLDDIDINVDSLYAVTSEAGVTRLGPIDEAGRSALRERLYTAGELLRLNQLAPDKNLQGKFSPRQLNLFD